MTSLPALPGRRIVFVLNWAALGGAERFALDSAVHLRDVHGAEVAVCAFTTADGRGRREAELLGIDWLPVPVSWDAARARKLHALTRVTARLRSLRPDVLLPVCAMPNLVCGLVWRGTGARACIWNQRDRLAPGRVREATMGYAARRTSLVAACAAHVATFVEERYRVPGGRIRIVRPGVELPPARVRPDEWRNRLGAAPGDVVVCMVAHLHRFKDHETLLRAWRLLQNRRQGGARIVLVLAGRPAGTHDTAKALAFDLDLRGSVVFAGDVEDVGGLLRACDVGVLSSRSEGIGRSVIEYMTAGMPVAGTDIDGIREAVGADGAAWLAPPGDHVRLAGILGELVGDEDLRRRLGKANVARAAAHFSTDAAHEQYAAIVAEALGRTVPAPSRLALDAV